MNATEMPARYFALLDHHGVDEDNNLEPINNVGLSIPMPVLKDGIIVEESHGVWIKPADKLTDDLAARVIPDTRIIETRSTRVADALLSDGYGQYVEIEAPSKAEIARGHAHTKAHLETCRRRVEDVASGAAPAPDATDNTADNGQED